MHIHPDNKRWNIATNLVDGVLCAKWNYSINRRDECGNNRTHCKHISVAWSVKIFFTKLDSKLSFAFFKWTVAHAWFWWKCPNQCRSLQDPAREPLGISTYISVINQVSWFGYHLLGWLCCTLFQYFTFKNQSEIIVSPFVKCLIFFHDLPPPCKNLYHSPSPHIRCMIYGNIDDQSIFFEAPPSPTQVFNPQPDLEGYWHS